MGKKTKRTEETETAPPTKKIKKDETPILAEPKKNKKEKKESVSTPTETIPETPVKNKKDKKKEVQPSKGDKKSKENVSEEKIKKADEKKENATSGDKTIFQQIFAEKTEKPLKGADKVNEAINNLFASIDVTKVATPKTTPAAPAPKSKKNENKENEESDDEKTIPSKKAMKGPKTKLDPKNRVAEERRGVIYIGHIPNGFFESQMQTFFSQFGDITRLRLARNKKTNHTKGYGWIEFELEEVADIVVKTMKGYMLDNRVLDVQRVPAEKVADTLFLGWNKPRKSLVNDNKNSELKRHNKKVLPDQIKGASLPTNKVLKSSRQVKRKNVRKMKTKQNLLELGIDYDPNM